MSDYIWKLWLRDNPLTKDVENDHVAEVSTNGKTLHNKDIAQAIKNEGSEVQLETLIDILDRGDRIRRHSLLEGYSVQTGLCHVSPRVTGSWMGATAHFDPSKHKLTFDMFPSPELHKALEQVGIEVLGARDSGAVIGLVTDAATGKTNGTITPNDDIIIVGEKIRIAPEGEAGLGIFFMSADGPVTPVTHRLLQNDPKKVIARVPALEAGSYTLKIVTKYTKGAVLLNEPRTIVYGVALTVA